MNAKIRKMVRMSRKKFLRTFILRYPTTEDSIESVIDVLSEFGLRVYADPKTYSEDDMTYFVSNKPLTVKWYINRQKNEKNKAWARRYYQNSSPTDEMEINP